MNLRNKTIYCKNVYSHIIMNIWTEIIRSDICFLLFPMNEESLFYTNDSNASLNTESYVPGICHASFLRNLQCCCHILVICGTSHAKMQFLWQWKPLGYYCTLRMHTWEVFIFLKLSIFYTANLMEVYLPIKNKNTIQFLSASLHDLEQIVDT